MAIVPVVFVCVCLCLVWFGLCVVCVGVCVGVCVLVCVLMCVLMCVFGCEVKLILGFYSIKKNGKIKKDHLPFRKKFLRIFFPSTHRKVHGRPYTTHY